MYSKQVETFHLRLLTQPTADVTVTVTSSDTASLTISPSTLTFTSENYFLGQKLTVYTTNTNSVSKESSFSVQVTYSATSSDANYNTLSQTSTVTIINKCIALGYQHPSTDSCPGLLGHYWYGEEYKPCPSGYYNSSASELLCTICPAGSYCSDATIGPTACADGFYSFLGMTECVKCPPGWECPNKNGMENKPCKIGTFADGGKSSCTACTAGNYCPTNELSAEIACPAGYYSGSGSSNCVECPGGYSCADPAASPVACADGSYALPG